MNIEYLKSLPKPILLKLYALAKESKSGKPIIRDEKAIEVTKILNEQYKKFDGKFYRDLVSGKISQQYQTIISLREKTYDRYIKTFLENNPKGVIVNIRAELDTKFFRNDNGELIWYEIDNQDRHDLIMDTDVNSERYLILETDINNIKWIYDIMKFDAKVLFLAENLYEFSSIEDAERLIFELSHRFIGSEFVCELFKSSNSEPLIDNILLLDEWSWIHENHVRLGWLKYINKNTDSYDNQRTVHYRFI